MAFLESWNAPFELSPSQVARYHEDGVLGLGELLSQAERDEVRSNLERYATTVVPHLPASVRERIVKLEPETGTPRHLYHLHQVDPYFERVGNSVKLMSIARQLVDWPPLLYVVESLLRAPGVSAGTPPHQEAAYFEEGEFHKSVNLWIALDVASRESGALRFWLGSHRAGLLPKAFTPAGRLTVDREAADKAAREIRVFEALPGQATVHDGFTVHDSFSNRSPNSRTAIVVAYRHAIGDLTLGAANVAS